MRKIAKVVLLGVLLSQAANAKGLAEKLLDINAPEYNEAMDQAQSLDSAGKSKLFKELAALFKSQKSDEARANAVSAVGDLSPEVPAAVPFLIEASRDKYFPLRQAALSGLQRSGQTSPDVVKAVTARLKDDQAGVRGKALDVLGGMGAAAKPAVGDIKPLLKDKDEAIRDLAQSAIKSIEGK